MNTQLKTQLKNVMESKNLTKCAFARFANVDPYTIKKLLNDEPQNFQTNTLQKIEKAIINLNKPKQELKVEARVNFLTEAIVTIENGKIIDIKSIERMDINSFNVVPDMTI